MRTLLIAMAGLVVALAAGTASAVELRDAELVAAGSPVLQNGTGTVQLEDSRLGRFGPLILVPEPGALWQMGSAIGVLMLLAGPRRRRKRFDTSHRSTRWPDSTTSRRRMS